MVKDATLNGVFVFTSTKCALEYCEKLSTLIYNRIILTESLSWLRNCHKAGRESISSLIS